MAIKLGTLIVDLQASTAAFEKGMRSAERISVDSARGIVDSLKIVGEQLTKLKFDDGAWKKSLGIIGGVAAGLGTAIAGASVEISRQVGETADSLGKLSQSYGVSVESISSMRVAAKMADLELEQLAMGMGKLAKNAAIVAKQGVDTGGAFETLGIKVRDSATKNLRPMDDLLGDVAEEFSKLKDGPAKTALAMELFGKSGATLIPFLNQGRAGLAEMNQLSKDLGLTWSGTDAAAATQFADSIKLLELRGQAFKEQYAKGVIPALNDIAAAFTKIDVGGKSVALTLGEHVGEAMKRVAVAVDWLVLELKNVWLGFQDIFESIGGVVQISGQALNKDLGGMATTLSELWANHKNRIAESDRLTGEFNKRAATILFGAPTVSLPSSKVPPSDVVYNNKTEDVTKSFKELESLLEKTRNLTNRAEGNAIETQISNLAALQRQLESFRAARPESIWSDINAAIRQVIATIDELREKEEAAFSAMMNEAVKKQGEVFATLPSATPAATGFVMAEHEKYNFSQDTVAQNAARLQLFNSTRTAAEAYADEVDKLNRLYDYGRTDSDVYSRAIANLRAQFNESYDPAVRYELEINRLNDALKSEALTEQARLEIKKQLRQLEAEKAAMAPGAGVGTGIKAGLSGFANEWQSWGVEGMERTVQALHGVQNAMSNAFTEMIMGTKSVGAAFAEMGRNMLASVVSALSEMLAKWIATHIAMAIISKIFGKHDDPLAQAQQKIAANVAVATSDAAVAAANTLALMSAMTPPPTPEIDAGIVYGIGMTFAGLASAAGGMQVDRDQLVQVHKDEKILPARLSRGFDRIIDSMSPRSGSGHLAPALATAGGGGSRMPMMPMTFNISGGNDPDAIAAKVSDVVMARVKTHFRTNGVRG